MASLWRRHKRKVVAAVALGAAGAAAAYYWWTYESEEQAEARRRRDSALLELQAIVQGDRRRGGAPAAGGGPDPRQQPGAAAPGDAPGDAGDAAAPLDESLEAHFNSIQALSERQALEDLLPRLREALYAATDYEPLRERLRAPGLGPDEKRALWGQLASMAFSRAMGAVWLVPLLDLLVRLKLHIVARHMYLEVQLPGMAPRGGGGFGGAWGRGLGGGGVGRGLGRGAMPPRLSDRAKEEFFRSDFFVEVGAAGLLHRLRRAVDQVLSAVDFSGAVTAGDIERLVIAVHARFEAEFQRAGDVWAAYLVPPGGQPVALHTAAGVEPLMSPVEATMVDELNAELREAVGDYRFLDALRAGVRHTSRAMGSYVASKMAPPGLQQPQKDAAGAGDGGQRQGEQEEEGGSAGEGAAAAEGGGGGGIGGIGGSGRASAPSMAELLAASQLRPFPMVVPIVAKSANLLFDEANRCTRGLSSLREVQALCACVFSFAPHLEDSWAPGRAV